MDSSLADPRCICTEDETRAGLSDRDKLEIIAKALLEFETLTGAQIEDIASTGQMSDPPKPKAPTPNEPQQPQVKLPEKLRPLPPDLPPGLAGAPA
jgi:hypothetical protein